MIYLALGDSITHGYDASNEAEKYVTKLVQHLNEKKKTSFYVHAKPGWTSQQLLKSLDRIPQCIVEEAELISLLIGGNDLIKAMPWFLHDKDEGMFRLRQSFYPQVEQIIDKVNVNPEAIFMLCTIYNPFPNSDLAIFAVDGLNTMLKQIAEQKHCVLVPVHHYYGGNEQELVNRFKRGALEDFRLFKNPIHPNDLGHTRIAEAIFKTVYPRKSDQAPQQKRLQQRKDKASLKKRHEVRKRV